jgi:DNA anti-recombination protein RmuC
VREGWEAPGRYVERQEAAERAVRAQQHQEASRARKAAEQAVERQKQEVAEQEASQLDVIWEKLDPKTRQRIETEAKERLGVLGQMGRAQGALLAMRRNLLREMMGNTNNPTM